VRGRVTSRLPSPALLVASLALFVALGGTTWAVTAPSKRSVGSVQLKKGAVRTENIARSAVTRSKLSSGLAARATRSAGASLRAGTSYAVRTAYAEKTARADGAALADKATTASAAAIATTAKSAANVTWTADADKLDGNDSSSLIAKSALIEIPRFTLESDETREILTRGAFTLTARCYINKLAADDADVLISTTQPHSAFHGFYNNADLNPTSVEGTRSLIGVEGPTGLPQFETSAYGTAVAPDGSEIRSIVLYVGLNLFADPGSCTFGGIVIP
jgi:hypothetical protein